MPNTWGARTFPRNELEQSMVASFDVIDRPGFSLAYLRPGRGPRSTFFWKAVLVAIVLLLVTIAVLQFRWIKQIHDDMEDRAHSSMEIAMTQWNRELYRGFYTICGSLLADPDLASLDGWEDYLQRYSALRHQEYHYNSSEAA